MTTILRMSALAVCLFWCTTAVQAQTDWQLVRESDGIKVFTRKVATLKCEEVLVKSTLEGSFSSVALVLRDVANYSTWISNCHTARLLEQKGDNQFYYYYEMNAYWPVSNRDMVMDCRITQNPDTKTLNMVATGIKGRVKEQDGLVRVTSVNMNITIARRPDGLLDLSYQVNMDPAGSVPAWVINMVIANGPFSTIQAFREVVKQGEYQKKAAGIVD